MVELSYLWYLEAALNVSMVVPEKQFTQQQQHCLPWCNSILSKAVLEAGTPPPSPAHSWDCRVHVLTAEQVRSKTKSQIATWAAPNVVLFFFFFFLYFRVLEWIFWGKLSMLFHLAQPESGTILIWKGWWSGWLRAIGETLLEAPYCILLHCCQLSNEESKTAD